MKIPSVRFISLAFFMIAVISLITCLVLIIKNRIEMEDWEVNKLNYSIENSVEISASQTRLVWKGDGINISVDTILELEDLEPLYSIDGWETFAPAIWVRSSDKSKWLLWSGRSIFSNDPGFGKIRKEYAEQSREFINKLEPIVIENRIESKFPRPVVSSFIYDLIRFSGISLLISTILFFVGKPQKQSAKRENPC